ncbi:RHS repeat-associated core domain-containing protein [Olivibacter oleidegradans]|uniref:RHS repeat-associated core domain-containing protein n=1 Tax=Olivibacter oleidegradans TaxID=760123 RepID=A0ABV6HGF8_9SPHI|nr:RHS repeat-associated core domain-containing protein [Olivibacter jilunii]
MYDYGARFYDAVVGRWGSVDPFVERHFNVTPYNYVLNNPPSYIDPFGLDTLNANNIDPNTWHNFRTNEDIMGLSEVNVTASIQINSNSSNLSNDIWGYFAESERHFNGSLGVVGAAYGVADYFFDIGGTIDSQIGRNSNIWKQDE